MYRYRIFILVSLFLISCASADYYQVFTLDSEPQMTLTNDAVIYEDSTFKILFNFWGEKGKVYFEIFNKLNENITLKLDETFFINNGFATSFFQNRSFEYQIMSLGTSTTYLNLPSGRSEQSFNYPATKLTTYSQPTLSSKVISKEKEKIIIPPKSFIVIDESTFNFIPYYYETKLLEKYPNENPQLINFTYESSPFIFRFRFLFETNETNRKIILDKAFYVSEIANHSEDTFFDELRIDYKLVYKLKYYSPNRFYIIYR